VLLSPCVTDTLVQPPLSIQTNTKHSQLGSASSSPTVGSADTQQPPSPAIHREQKEKEELQKEWSQARTKRDNGKGRPSRTHGDTAMPGKPDSPAYHAEQERIKAEIDVLQAQLVGHRGCWQAWC